MSAESDELSPVELLAEEFLERQQRGEKPTIGEYCEKHPDLADEIREVFEALAMMEELKPDSHDATGTFGSGIQTDGRRLERVGDYRILREIGRGGMGVVYEAEQESLRRRVALKVLPRRVAGDEKALVRFQREARAAARMHHTNIVPVFDVGEDDEHVFYAMQMIQGQGLDLVVDDLKRLRTDHVAVRQDASADRAFAKQELEERQSLAASLVTGRFHQENLVAEARREENGGEEPSGSLPVALQENPGLYAETILQDSGSTASAVLPGQSQLSTAETNRNAYFRSVAEIGLQTARALSYAHARGIIHRDIKPSNLLLDAAGVVWVTDFGLAKTSDEAMTHTGDILGTIRYMSPERFKGQCDVRADVYSLGLTLYELLVLRPAFSSPDRLRLIEMVSSTEPPTPRSLDPRVPRDLETILLKSIDKDPRRRYQSADEMCEDLERFIQDEPIKARRISLTERLTRWSRRNRGLAAALATVCALLLLINIAGPLVTLHMAKLNDELQASQVELEDERDRAEERARENEELARQKILAAEAADHAVRQTGLVNRQLERQQDLTRRNLYAAEINMAQLAGLTGDAARREELLSHWQTTDADTDLRGIEYFLLGAEIHDEYTEIRSHSGVVGVVTWSPDGTRVATGGFSGEIHICDSESGEVLQVLNGHTAPVFGLDWRADGSRLASGSDDGTIRVWDLDAAQELLTIRGHSRTVFRVAWAPDGRRVASAGWDGTARVWDAETGEQLASFSENALRCFHVAWHPDGDRLASSGEESVIHVWNAVTGSEVESFAGHSQGVWAVDWAPDGTRLASSGESGECFIWQSGQSQPIHTLRQHGGFFSWLDWSPDGRWLSVTDGRDGIRVHNADTGEEFVKFRGHAEWQSCIAWSPDSRRLASSSADGSVRIWQVDEAGQAPGFATGTDRVTASDWMPDGRQLVTGDHSGTIRLWDTVDGDMVREFAVTDGALVHVNALRLNADGTLLAAGGRPDNDIFIWDTATGDLVHRLVGPALERISQSSGIRSIAWSNSQDRLAVGNTDGSILLWDTRTGEQIDELETSSTINGLCFVPHSENRWLISGQFNRRVKVWDLTSGQPVQDLDMGAPVRAVDVSRDGLQVAAGGGSFGNELSGGLGFVRVWNVQRSSDTLALRDELVLPGPRDVILTLQYTADSRRLLAGGQGGSVHVWDTTEDLSAARRRQLLVLEAAGMDHVETVRVNRDGTSLAAAGNSGDVQIWDAWDGFTRELSPLLLPMLERRMIAGTASAEDHLLRARILARQGHWSAAAAVFDHLLERPDSPKWYLSDLWVLDGAFPGQLDTVYPPEQIAGVNDFDVLEPIALDEASSRTARWRPRRFPPNTLLDFGALLGNRIDVSGYALLRVYVARNQSVGLLIGADDQHRIWLNGDPIHEGKLANSASPDEHAVPVELQRGWNTLLAKVTNSQNFHGLYLSLSDNPASLAPVYRRSGESRAAAEMWDRAVELNPNSAPTLLLRARFLWSIGEFDAAESDFERAIEIGGDAVGSWLARARIFAIIGREDDAVADMNRAMELSPGSPSLLVERGDWNVRLGRFEQGASDLRRAIALNPTDHWKTYHLTSLLLKTGDIDGYEQLRADMLERWGDSADPVIAERTTKAGLLWPADDEMLDRFDVLMESTRNVGAQHRYLPHFLGARGMLQYRQGEAQLASGDQTGAQERFQVALDLLSRARSRGVGEFVGTHVDVYRAMVLHRMGRADQALRMLQAAEESLSGDDFTQPGERFNNRWHDEFMPRIAFREAARLIHGEGYDELAEGERLLAAGDVDSAIDHLEQAIVLAPDSDWLWQEALTLVEDYRAGYDVFVSTSEHENAVEWQYRFAQPPAGWMTGSEVDDSGWHVGTAPFGSYQPNSSRTFWSESEHDIWLRVTFDVTEPPTGKLTLRTYIDEDAEIFINGVLCASGVWIGDAYLQRELPRESAEAIRTGTNVLAVHCSNDELGTGIDVGLYEESALIQERLLSAALSGSPESPELLRQRAERYLRLDELEQAADDSFQVVQLGSDRSLDLVKAAALLVAIGDVDRYGQVCQAALDRFAASNQVSNAEHVVKLCSILPQQDDSLRAAVTRITVDELGPNPDFVWAKMSGLLGDYRREAYQDAIDRGHACLAISRVEEAGFSAYRNMTAFAYLTQAMSWHRLGDRERAEAAFQKGLETCNSNLPEYPEIGWWDTFISRSLLREADALINGNL